MKYIPLSQGFFAIVDDDMYEYLNQWKWTAAIQKTDMVYAQRIPWKKGGKGRKPIFMHRIVLRPPFGMFTDHINRDGIDNRLCNLRPCTTSQNAANQRKQSMPSASRYKGVGKYKRGVNPWCARIKYQGTLIHLGVFRYEENAAIAYDAKALELFGEFARLNFPERTQNANC